MVIFDVLQMSNDSRNIVIKAHISDSQDYKGMYIKNLYLNKDDDFLASGLNTNKIIYSTTFDTTTSPARLTVYSSDGPIGYIYDPSYYTISSEGKLEKEVKDVSKELDDKQIYLLDDFNINDDPYVAIRLKDGTTVGIPITIVDLYNDNNGFTRSALDSLDMSCYIKILKGETIYPREISLVINSNEILNIDDFSSNIFFVYIETAGTPGPCTPCGADNRYTIGVVFNTELIYRAGLTHIKELADTCNVSQNFALFVLNWEAFKVFIESGRYIEAIKAFHRLFRKGSVGLNFNCGCHGKISS